MKVLPIVFPDSEDLGSFAMHDVVAVVKGETTVNGKVLTDPFRAPDPPPPPTLEGVYNISPVTL